MKVLMILVILVAFFLGLALLVHICSKNGCVLKYSSLKRKIEIRPQQANLTQPIDKG